MMHRFLLLFAALAVSAPALSATAPCGPRRVALSFDDAPRAGTPVMSGWERTKRIIAALYGAGVEEAAFFSLSEPAVGEGRDRLLAYAEAGHVIASHSGNHPNLHNVGAGTFLENVRAAHNVLSRMPGFRPLFRFPYLNEGSSIADRDAVRAGLSNLGYEQGYVTIDTYDFYIDNFLRQAAESKRDVDREALGRLYVESILGAADHYDSLACQWLGRSPAHVLLLHENDAAALYLDRLIEALRAKGWTIISPTEAYSDPIARSLPDTLLLGQGRVAALAHLAGASPESLRHESESTVYLDRRFQEMPVSAPPADANSAPDPDVAAIMAQTERFSKAYVDDDVDTLVSIYAENGVAGPVGRDFIRGRDALRRYWEADEGVDVIRHQVVSEEIVVEGRFAYDWGYYSGALVSGGKTNAFRGKHLIVWRKDDDGVWRIVQDVWNGVADE